MSYSILRLRSLALAGAAILLVASVPSRAHAAFLLTLTQSGGNVVVNGSGTLNLSALTYVRGGASNGTIIPDDAVLYSGPATFTNFLFYNGLTGPAAFGAGLERDASSGSGNIVGVEGNAADLIVPSAYVSGTALTNTNTYNGVTFASLGFTPGTYVYTWGTGANADSLTITSVVPEPSTWALLGVGVVGLGLTLRRRATRV